MKILIIVLLLTGCGTLYPIPEEREPFVKDEQKYMSNTQAICGNGSKRFIKGRWVISKPRACAFVGETPCRIVYTEGDWEFIEKHERAHCDGTLSHAPITPTEAWVRLTGSSETN